MNRSAASISLVGLVFALASVAGPRAAAETSFPQPLAPCSTENGRVVCRAENALLVWCKTRSRLTQLEDAVAREPARDHVLIADASRDQQCGTTAGVIMNVARSPEYTLEGTLHPIVSVKIFTRAKQASSSGSTRWGQFVSCKVGSTDCSTTKSLFACPFDQAVQIMKQTPGSDAVLQYSKGCEVVSIELTFEVEATQDPRVVYAKHGDRHIGYVPTNVALGLVASGSFPAALQGVWLSSEARCRELLRNRMAYEHDDHLEITPVELRGHESTSRLLTMESSRPGSWRIALHSSGEGEEWLESVTFQLSGDRLRTLKDGSAFERVRCGPEQRVSSASREPRRDAPGGAGSPQEIADAKSLRRFNPLRLKGSGLVTEGRCHMGSCSWARWLSAQVVDKSGGEIKLMVQLIGGESPMERGSRIKWNELPHFIEVTCSERRPIIRNGKNETELKLGPKHSTPAVLLSSAKIYILACHSDMSDDPDKAASYYKYNIEE